MDEILTDLNDRERDRYAKSLDALAESASKLAAAIRGKNDTEMTVQFVILTLSGQVLHELAPIIKTALKVPISPDQLLRG